MAPRLRPLLTPPNDGTQKENRLDLRVALKMGAGHYNPRRRHSKLGYLSPMEFEARAMLA
jgi:transposase InsO family protein